MTDNVLTRRDFLKKTGQAALAISGGLTLEALLDGCAGAPIFESPEDVANIKWDANPAIPVPKNGCYAGWHLDIIGPVHGQARPKYWRKVASSSKKAEHDLEKYHGEPYGKLPAVYSFSDRLVGRDEGFFPKGIFDGSFNKGVIPLVRYYFFEDFENVARGKYDKTLKNFAQGAKEFGKPFFLVPYPEVNISGAYKNVHPWAGGNGKQFRKAWTHMHDVFEGEGANEYAVWGLHLLGSGDKQPFSWFDLDDKYLDWVGFTIYNFGQTGWVSRSFDTRIQEGYWWVKQNHPTKPIALWEFAAEQTSGKGQSRWIKNAYNSIKKMPRIKLVVYAEYGGHGGAGAHNSLMLDEKSKPYYKEAISDPYFIGSKARRS